MLLQRKELTDSLISIKEIPLGHANLKEFIRFPWRLYKGDPHWIPPLESELIGNRILGMKGIMTPSHPYHRNSETTHFVTYREGIPAGRIAVAINHRFNEHYNVQTANLCFFESVNDPCIAETLFNAVCNWSRNKGMTTLQGPMSYSNAAFQRGILIEGFQYPQTMETYYNPPYYAELFEHYGFEKAKDYYAYITDTSNPSIPRLRKIAEYVIKRHDLFIRPINTSDFLNDIRLIMQLINESFTKNWGVIPITYEEICTMAKSLQLIVDPGLIRLAFVGNRLVGVAGAIPDINYALKPGWKWYEDFDMVRMVKLLLKRKRIPYAKGLFFCILPEFRNMGIDASLIYKCAEYGLNHGYRQIEVSLVLEDNNPAMHIYNTLKGQKNKCWRVYKYHL